MSWFEANAYCAYRGKALPTVQHWRKAAGFGIYSDILLFSNFANAGPSRVGAHTGISAFGAYDMAGNVKEWCQNGSGELRAILGGGWNEPAYAYQDADAQDPFSRAATYGLRCASYPSAIPPAALAPMEPPLRDYSKEKPVNDDTFEIFRRLYTYDKTALDTRTESVDESNDELAKRDRQLSRGLRRRANPGVPLSAEECQATLSDRPLGAGIVRLAIAARDRQHDAVFQFPAPHREERFSTRFTKVHLSDASRSIPRDPMPFVT